MIFFDSKVSIRGIAIAKLVKENKQYRNISIIVLILLSIASLLYGLYIADGTFRNDYFRHFKLIIIPLLSGEFNPKFLFLNHHATPLLHFHQIASLYLYNGFFYFDLLVGVMLLLAIACILMQMSWEYFFEQSYPLFICFIFSLLVGFAIVAFVSYIPFAWPLISLNSYHLLFGTLVIIFANKIIRHSQESKLAHAWMVLMTFGITILHSSFGTIFSTSVALSCLFYSVKQKRCQLAYDGIAIIAILILWNGIFLSSVRDTGYGKSLDLAYLIAELKNIYWYAVALGNALANATYGGDFTSRSGLGPEKYYFVYFCYGLVFVCVTVWAMFKNDNLRVPGMIMLAVLLGSVATALTRGAQHGFPWHITPHRYVLFYKLGIAAFFWSLFALIGEKFLLKGRLKNRIFWLVIIVFIMSYGYLQYSAGVVLLHSVPYLRMVNANRELALYMKGVDAENSYKLTHYISGKNGPEIYSPVISWLKKNEFNVFSSRYHGYELLRNYKIAADIFAMPRKRIEHVLPLPEENCVEYKSMSDLQAWRAGIVSNEGGELQVRSHDGTSEKKNYFLLPGKIVHQGIFEKNKEYSFCCTGDNHLVSLDVVTIH